MLDKEKLNQWVLNPLTEEQRIVSILYSKYRGICKLDLLVNDLLLTRENLLVQIGRSPYLKHDSRSGLVSLHRSGKDLSDRYATSELRYSYKNILSDESDYIFSPSLVTAVSTMIYHNPDISYEETLDKLEYCQGDFPLTMYKGKKEHFFFYRKNVRRILRMEGRL